MRLVDMPLARTTILPIKISTMGPDIQNIPLSISSARWRLLAAYDISKYADGLLLYRQEAIYLRDGVEISRNLMVQWMGHLGFELQICADYILERVR